MPRVFTRGYEQWEGRPYPQGTIYQRLLQENADDEEFAKAFMWDLRNEDPATAAELSGLFKNIGKAFKKLFKGIGKVVKKVAPVLMFTGIGSAVPKLLGIKSFTVAGKFLNKGIPGLLSKGKQAGSISAGSGAGGTTGADSQSAAGGPTTIGGMLQAAGVPDIGSPTGPIIAGSDAERSGFVRSLGTGILKTVSQAAQQRVYDAVTGRTAQGADAMAKAQEQIAAQSEKMMDRMFDMLGYKSMGETPSVNVSAGGGTSAGGTAATPEGGEGAAAAAPPPAKDEGGAQQSNLILIALGVAVVLAATGAIKLGRKG